MSDPDVAFAAAKKFLAKKDLGDREMNLDPTMSHPCVGTGNEIADYVMGGEACPGFPRGMISEIFGPESCGKSTFMTQVCGNTIREGGSAVYIDYEQAFQPRYAVRLGLDVESDRFAAYQPVTFEEMNWIMKAFVRGGADLIVIDSLAAMIPRKVLHQKDMDKDARIGEHARLTSQLLNRTVAWLKQSGCQTAVVFVNQTRQKINTSSGKGGKAPSRSTSVTTTGGSALRFYAAMRLRLQPLESENYCWKDPLTDRKWYVPSHTEVMIKNAKNKVSDRQQVGGILTLQSGYGFGVLDTAIDLALRSGLVEKNGSWFTLNLEDSEPVKIQGRIKLRDHIQGDEGLRSKVVGRIKQVLLDADRQFLEQRASMATHSQAYSEDWEEGKVQDDDEWGEDRVEWDDEEDQDS